MELFVKNLSVWPTYKLSLRRVHHELRGIGGWVLHVGVLGMVVNFGLMLSRSWVENRLLNVVWLVGSHVVGSVVIHRGVVVLRVKVIAHLTSQIVATGGWPADVVLLQRLLMGSLLYTFVLRGVLAFRTRQRTNGIG